MSVEPVKVFADKALRFDESDECLVPMVKAHWSDLTPEQRLEKYPDIGTIYQPVDTIENAEICCLPLRWTSYVRSHHRRSAAIEFAKRAAAHGKQVLVWSDHDFEPIIPFENAILLHRGLHHSFQRNIAAAYGMPAFFHDPVRLYFEGRLPIRQKRDQPTIGFCGQAKGKPLSIGKWVSQTLTMRVLHSAGRSPYVPPPILPPYWLRLKAIKRLRSTSGIATDFVIRDQYRAGVKKTADRLNPAHQSNLDYMHNIANTDYTLCVRGAGNYSVRFYHTLSLGRIPILINTDCVLPLDSVMEWKQHCVWVELHEIDHIGEMVVDFHASMSPENFVERQHACRTLWEKQLSGTGFHKHLRELIIPAHYGDPKPETRNR